MGFVFTDLSIHKILIDHLHHFSALPIGASAGRAVPIAKLQIGHQLRAELMGHWQRLTASNFGTEFGTEFGAESNPNQARFRTDSELSFLIKLLINV